MAVCWVKKSMPNGHCYLHRAVSAHGPAGLYFEPLMLLNFDCNTDPAFHSNTDLNPDPISKNNADPDPQKYVIK